MLKKIRIVFSLILFTLITLYFLDFREFLPDRLSFLVEIQFIPALLALNTAILGFLVVLTLLFGRVYCSSICPMGVYQDIVSWFSKRFHKKKKYKYSKAKTLLRWGVLAGTVIAFFFGFTFLLGLLDPYGIYGRIVTHLFRPAYLAGNNLLEVIFTSFNRYTFYKVSIYTLSVFSLVMALMTLLVIGYLAWHNGRTWCNTICPVGTALGFLSKLSFFKVRFVDEKCNMCGLCSMKCKAACIDSKNKQVDYSRCINCFNCIESCNRNAMKYAFALPHNKKDPVVKGTERLPTYTYLKDEKQVNESKRRFLSASLVTGLAAGNLVAQMASDSIFPEDTSNLLALEDTSGDLLPKRSFKRQTPVAPPGTPTFDHLREKCISCHLCVSKCPSHVIKPAFLEYGLGGMMQPKLYFDHGFCNYDCTICGEVCPTGAILPLSKEEKNHTQMGQVQLIIENCIVYYDETSCGACSEHCPTQAVRMIPYKGHLTIPEIEPEICVGCGGCEYVCPAIPYKAIYVEGLESQNNIEIEHDEVEDITIDDFGF